MHRSSESVAAIATALAKAQTELSNPEKAMVGTVYNSRSDSPQSFRYASLSSGLDIVRKTLGRHEIAPPGHFYAQHQAGLPASRIEFARRGENSRRPLVPSRRYWSQPDMPGRTQFLLYRAA